MASRGQPVARTGQRAGGGKKAMKKSQAAESKARKAEAVRRARREGGS